MITNLMLFVVIHLVCYSALSLLDRFFGKAGIYSWIAFAVCAGQIGACCVFDVIPPMWTVGGGLAVMASTFLATDILTERYGKKEGQKGATIAIVMCVLYIIISQLYIHTSPNAETLPLMESMRDIAQLSPVFTLFSLLAVIVGGLLDVFLFDKLKQRDGQKRLWLRNNVCTIISQVVDNSIFCISYIILGICTLPQTLALILVCTIAEAFSAVLDTPFAYLRLRWGKVTE